MRLSDFIVREAVVTSLSANTKEGVIREMVNSLLNSGRIQPCDVDEIVRAILKREMLGSTAISRGVAIPHAKHGSIKRLIGTIGVHASGVGFDSKDGSPVHVIVMIVSPEDRPGDHLRALDSVSRALRNEPFVGKIRSAGTLENMNQLIDSPESLG
jgi:PTS system fructose-specific IIA component/PTS system nitrogen regulatory IIA component